LTLPSPVRLLEADVALTLGFTEQVTVAARGRRGNEKAVPVDIITHEQIASSSYTETAQLMESIAPSFNFPRPTIPMAPTRSGRRHCAASAPIRCSSSSTASGVIRARSCT
jgi:hypothetical protein